MAERGLVFIDGNNWFHCLRDAGVEDRLQLDYGDFTGAVEFIRGLTKKVYVACPGYGAQLARVATKFVHLNPEWFRDCYR